MGNGGVATDGIVAIVVVVVVAVGGEGGLDGGRVVAEGKKETSRAVGLIYIAEMAEPVDDSASRSKRSYFENPAELSHAFRRLSMQIFANMHLVIRYFGRRQALAGEGTRIF